MTEESPSCAGPFEGAQLEYPIHFDLRVIYRLADVRDFQADLEAAMAKVGVPWTLIQDVVKPDASYGRMGARVTVDSKQRMDLLYAAVAAIPGVKAVI
jgi:putative lipoic acid-binding regulatory protein